MNEHSMHNRMCSQIINTDRVALEKVAEHPSDIPCRVCVLVFSLHFHVDMQKLLLLRFIIIINFHNMTRRSRCKAVDLIPKLLIKLSTDGTFILCCQQYPRANIVSA